MMSTGLGHAILIQNIELGLWPFKLELSSLKMINFPFCHTSVSQLRSDHFYDVVVSLII